MYGKDKIFYKYCLDLEDKNVLYESENEKTQIPLYTPFFIQRKEIHQFSALYSIKVPFKLVRADVVHIRFFSMSAVDPKYCLLAMDLFTSKKYTYPRKSRHHFVQINRTFLSRYSAKKVTGCKKQKDDTAD